MNVQVKIGKKNGKTIVSAAWVDKEVRMNQELRQILSRKLRYARRKGRPKEELEILEGEYKRQQRFTSRLKGHKKGAWEKKHL